MPIGEEASNYFLNKSIFYVSTVSKAETPLLDQSIELARFVIELRRRLVSILSFRTPLAKSKGGSPFGPEGGQLIIRIAPR